MRRFLALLLAAAATVPISACQTPQQQNAFFGGAFGAGTGALLGAAATPPAYDAGLALPPHYAGLALPPYYAGPPPPTYFGLPPGPPPGPSRCAQWVFDYTGNRVCTAFY